MTAIYTFIVAFILIYVGITVFQWVRSYGITTDTKAQLLLKVEILKRELKNERLRMDVYRSALAEICIEDPIDAVAVATRALSEGCEDE